MDDKAKLETLNHFFKVHGRSTDRCHEPSESCDQPAIRAHSIPGGTVLDKMAEDGHVVMPQMKPQRLRGFARNTTTISFDRSTTNCPIPEMSHTSFCSLIVQSSVNITSASKTPSDFSRHTRNASRLDFHRELSRVTSACLQPHI